MYGVSEYGKMIADPVRMNAYAKALREAVKPDSAVLDIGTGTGIFALLACQFGARCVYAIESGEVIEIARAIAQANGYAERVQFFCDVSMRVALPERVNIIISDLHGVLPWFENHVTAIADARQRFLAPAGVLIPRRDTLWAALVDSPELYGSTVQPWIENNHGLDMEAALRVVTNTWRKARVRPEQLLVEPRRLAVLDYSNCEDPNMAAEVPWKIERCGTARGLCLWFDSDLAEGVSFSNAPGAPEGLYGQAFFPLTTPVALDPGDSVTVGMRANFVHDDYIWRWETCVRSTAATGQSKIKAKFAQSTFYGAPLSTAGMRKRAANYVPVLNSDGEIDRFILDLMDGNSSQEEIARRLADRFPARFPSWEEGLTRVSFLSPKYSR